MIAQEEDGLDKMAKDIDEQRMNISQLHLSVGVMLNEEKS